MDDSKSLSGKWLFNQTSILSWLFGVPGKTSRARFFFLDRKFSPKNCLCLWVRYTPFPQKNGPSLIVGTSFFVFLVLGWLLTSEDQRVDGWLLQKIISLQTDCFIELYIFSKRRGSGSWFFHLKGLIHESLRVRFLPVNFSGEKKTALPKSFFQKKYPSGSTSGLGCWWFGIQIGRYPLPGDSKWPFWDGWVTLLNG